MSGKIGRTVIAALVVLLLVGSGLALWMALLRTDGEAKVVERLPDLTIYDSDGQPFHLNSLRGSYAVLVYGCET